MKTLQNNFTTPEQSKRLLELGVPAGSADCMLVPLVYDERKKETIYNKPMIINGVFSNYSYLSHKHMEYLPCWSVGRLIEIFSKCYTGTKGYYSPRNLYKTEFWIERFNRLTIIGFMDFSKLED